MSSSTHEIGSAKKKSPTLKTPKKTKKKTGVDKLPAGVWRNNGKLWIAYTDHVGRRIRESADTDNVAVAEILVTRKRAEAKALRKIHMRPDVAIIEAQLSDAERLLNATYQELLDMEHVGYLASISHLTSMSEERYNLHRFARFEIIPGIPIGSYRVADIDSNVVSRFLSSLSLAGATKNRYRTYITKSLGYAVSKGTYPQEQLDHLYMSVKRMPEPSKTKRAYTKEQLHSLLDVAHQRNLHLCDIIRFAVVTGYRASRIYGLTWDQIDFQRNEIKTPPKKPGGGEHVLPLSAPIKRILEERLAVRRPDVPWVFYNPTPNKRQTHQWKSLNESWLNILAEAKLRVRMDKKSVTKRAKINAELVAQGLEPLPEPVAVDTSLDAVFHGLRHVFGSALAETTPTVTISRLLGHSSLQITERYIESLRSPQAHIEPLNRLDSWIDHVKDPDLEAEWAAEMERREEFFQGYVNEDIWDEIDDSYSQQQIEERECIAQQERKIQP
ncbi:tyrosine-type recombinase/integrase [Citrifermentans bremense]|uniref:tyrosine-type recombinase/integrase n=1 Tax=Citrifermentans bremense TaxID=60035 RepID=UPI0003F4DE4B|nr:tyrosine-type recombinase/integrase [Citrifermentans bremense]